MDLLPNWEDCTVAGVRAVEHINVLLQQAPIVRCRLDGGIYPVDDDSGCHPSRGMPMMTAEFRDLKLIPTPDWPAARGHDVLVLTPELVELLRALDATLLNDFIMHDGQWMRYASIDTIRAWRTRARDAVRAMVDQRLAIAHRDGLSIEAATELDRVIFCLHQVRPVDKDRKQVMAEVCCAFAHVDPDKERASHNINDWYSYLGASHEDARTYARAYLDRILLAA